MIEQFNKKVKLSESNKKLLRTINKILYINLKTALLPISNRKYYS